MVVSFLREFKTEMPLSWDDYQTVKASRHFEYLSFEWSQFSWDFTTNFTVTTTLYSMMTCTIWMVTLIFTHRIKMLKPPCGVKRMVKTAQLLFQWLPFTHWNARNYFKDLVRPIAILAIVSSFSRFFFYISIIRYFRTAVQGHQSGLLTKLPSHFSANLCLSYCSNPGLPSQLTGLIKV